MAPERSTLPARDLMPLIHYFNCSTVKTDFVILQMMRILCNLPFDNINTRNILSTLIFISVELKDRFYNL